MILTDVKYWWSFNFIFVFFKQFNSSSLELLINLFEEYLETAA